MTHPHAGETLFDKLMRRTDRSGDCWLWTGPLNRQGYATLGYPPRSGKTTSLQRAVYRELVGDIPDGYHVHHTCGVRHCGNPAHLRAIPAGEHPVVHGNSLRQTYSCDHCGEPVERFPSQVLDTVACSRACAQRVISTNRKRNRLGRFQSHDD